MKIVRTPIHQAVGHILVHNLSDASGRKILKKGHRLTDADLPVLQTLERQEVYVAMLEADDLHENEAARRLGEAVAGQAIERSRATTGRVNLITAANGLLKINVAGLLAFNDRSGITLATRLTNTVVSPKTIVGTLKIIPYALPRADVDEAEKVARDHGPLVAVKPFTVKQAILITTGNEQAREKVIKGFTPALKERLASYGAELIQGPFTPEDEAAICRVLRQTLDAGAEMIIVAGETSIMDVDDVTPRAIRAAGAEIEHYGTPVEPGNLLLLAYYGSIPIVGAPGCARSKHYNVVDMVLPRLAAGERLTRKDLIALGHGGLLH